MKKRDKPIDWAAVEKDYVASAMCIREMARWHSLDEKAIRKKATAAGWVRHEEPHHISRLDPPAERIVADNGNLTDRARSIAGRMMDELDAVTSLHGELEDMICTEESDPRRRQALLKALSLSDRAMTLKNLSTTLKTLNEAAAPDGKKAERQAAAEKVAGRFAVPGTPKLVVNNRR